MSLTQIFPSDPHLHVMINDSMLQIDGHDDARKDGGDCERAQR